MDVCCFMRIAILLLVLLFPFALTAQEKTPDKPATAKAAAAPKRIHVVVALCDNESQGIQKVGARIGDGDKPDDNLYWGCSDGLREWFKKSPNWRLTDVAKADLKTTPGAKILRTLTFEHKTTGAILTAEAWRGLNIYQATERYFEKLIESGDDAPDLVAYIGHNGLMDFGIPKNLETINTKPKDSIVLCCISDRFFEKQLAKRQVTPVLMTDQLMYPGAFLLEAALEGWLKGEAPEKLRDRAAAAYQKNQKISFRAARGIFSELEVKAEVQSVEDQ